jgi:hypothetical protein
VLILFIGVQSLVQQRDKEPSNILALFLAVHNGGPEVYPTVQATDASFIGRNVDGGEAPFHTEVFHLSGIHKGGFSTENRG